VGRKRALSGLMLMLMMMMTIGKFMTMLCDLEALI
jgi:hypothetical protein